MRKGRPPSLKRRELLASAALAWLWPGVAASQARRVFVDSAGRRVELPERVDRIYAAGPPASILVYAIAPDKLIGWTSAWREAERPFIARRYADLPTLGRLTGRGNTANVEVVLQAKPDFIVDTARSALRCPPSRTGCRSKPASRTYCSTANSTA